MERDNLVKTLNLASLALAKTSLVPIWECFKFSGGHVTTYNDEIGIVVPCDIGIEVAIHGRTLLGLLVASSSKDVKFEIESHDVSIETGKSHFLLPFNPPADFLFDVPEAGNASVITIDDSLREAFECCLKTSSTDLAMPALMGITIADNHLYSCDGDAITRWEHKYRSKGKYLIPNGFCEALLKIEGPGALYVDDKWAIATFDDGCTLYGKVIAPQNPVDHKTLIERTLKGNVDWRTVPEGLNEALIRARVVADPESAPTVLCVEDGHLIMTTTTQNGIVADDMPFDHKNITAKVIAAKVQEAIKICKQMAIAENCTAFSGAKRLIVVSNMGD